MKSYSFKYDIGDPVKIIDLEVHGKIDSLSVDFNNKMYRVVYWINGERKATWVYDWEIIG